MGKKDKGIDATADEWKAGGFAAGSRTSRPHSPSGWVHDRDAKPAPKADPNVGGFAAGDPHRGDQR